MAITRADLQDLAELYLQSPDSSNDRRVRDMVDAEVRRINKEFTALTRKIDVVFVSHDPYQSYEEMKQRVLSDRRMLVYTGSSETPLWDETTNWKARAVHDWDHIVKDVDFSMEGEAAAFRASAARAPGLAPLYLSEIALQAAVQNWTGSFAPQKLVMPGDRADRIARRVSGLRGAGLRGDLRGGNSVAATPELAWEAAGILRVSDMPALMVHLKMMGLDQDSAVEVATAAYTLNKFDRRKL